MKNLLILLSLLSISVITNAQDLSSMQWFNAPDKWDVKGNTLKMFVTPQTDYWRKTHYGFTVDDGPFYYANRGGEFEVSVKITGAYKTRFDQMGLMLRVDEKHWIKTGIEYVDGVYNFSAVVTNGHSSWSVIALKEKPKSIWIKAIKKRDAVEILYSLDGKNYQMSNLAYLPDHKPVMVGMMAASPDGSGFDATFEDFKITHLPDERRLEWLENNKE
ncbi:DUF1349 domain-containing protein [Flammeovirga pectinis]|uniref:DUF1349 domain-containing protein n=1 Tax=Flammeovirga pectinis TaxID=2494373 RepID=A0A3S9P7Y8_9BACT|nr:DUF1349 domain-containing protein [Flammeovirga pectinis]AZQ64297.1 DUF1349 domain-containing protein [Flammeovirga pectinis]